MRCWGKTLDGFEGVVFTISHDRYLLDNVLDRFVELRDGITREFIGVYPNYAAARGG